jgi:hypothetical protein
MGRRKVQQGSLKQEGSDANQSIKAEAPNRGKKNRRFFEVVIFLGTPGI